MERSLCRYSHSTEPGTTILMPSNGFFGSWIGVFSLKKTPDLQPLFSQRGDTALGKQT